MLCVGSSPRSDMTFGLPATALSALTSTILRGYAIMADVQNKKGSTPSLKENHSSAF